MSAPKPTEVLKVDADHPQPAVIARAAAIIKAGGLVAFPTETVYGLGTNALNGAAVAHVFQAKKRPTGTPLIVLVADRKGLETVAAEIPPIAEMLMARFWPGPLTLTFPKSDRVPVIVTGGLDAVSVRMPGSRIALELVKASGTPIVAPSANLHGQASPTTGDHVLKDLGGSIDLLLDGGNVGTGIESTILDICHSPPVLIRSGAVSLKDIETVIGKVVARDETATHYVPHARLVIVKRGDREKLARLAQEYRKEGKRVGLVTKYPDMYAEDPMLDVRTMPLELSGYARQLFGVLRELDEAGIACIAVEEVEEEGVGIAIMDRLRRAAAHTESGGQQRQLT